MIEVRRITENDLPQVAYIHKKIFGDHYLGKLSEDLIAKFYKEFYNANCFLVALIDNKVVGFVVGGWSVELDRASAKFVRKYKMQSILEIIVKPNTWADTIKRIVGVLKPKKKEVVVEPNKVGGKGIYRLLSIGVDSNYQRKNIASLMMQEFEKHAFITTTSYGLSVHDSNNKAIALYLKMGFVEDARIGDSIFFMKYLEE